MRKLSPLAVLLLLPLLGAVLLVPAGCGDDDPTSSDGGPRPCSTRLGASVQTPTGGFVPLTLGGAPAEADLVLGFQRFRSAIGRASCRVDA